MQITSDVRIKEAPKSSPSQALVYRSHPLLAHDRSTDNSQIVRLEVAQQISTMVADSEINGLARVLLAKRVCPLSLRQKGLLLLLLSNQILEEWSKEVTVAAPQRINSEACDRPYPLMNLRKERVVCSYI